MKNIFLYKVIPIFTVLVVLTGCLVVPVSAASSVSGDTVYWDGNSPHSPIFVDSYDSLSMFHSYELVSSSVPARETIPYLTYTVTTYSSEAGFSERSLYPDRFQWFGSDLCYAEGFVVFVYAPGTYSLGNSNITLDAAGTYLLSTSFKDPGGFFDDLYVYCASLTIPDFAFAPLTASSSAASRISIFDNVYSILGNFFYGGAEDLTSSAELTLTFFATAACAFVFVAPFLMIFFFFKRWF